MNLTEDAVSVEPIENYYYVTNSKLENDSIRNSLAFNCDSLFIHYFSAKLIDLAGLINFIKYS